MVLFCFVWFCFVWFCFVLFCVLFCVLSPACLIRGRLNKTPLPSYSLYHMKRARRYMDHLDRLDIYKETEDFFEIGQFKTYHGSAHLACELPDVGHCLWALVKRVTYRGEPFPTAFSDGTFMEGFTAYTRHRHLVTALTWHLLLVLFLSMLSLPKK